MDDAIRALCRLVERAGVSSDPNVRAAFDALPASMKLGDVDSWRDDAVYERAPRDYFDALRKLYVAAARWCYSERMRRRLTDKKLIEQLSADELRVVDRFHDFDDMLLRKANTSPSPVDRKKRT